VSLGNASFSLVDLKKVPLTAAQADAVSGDWRQCFYAILMHTLWYGSLLPADQKPEKLTITRAKLDEEGTEWLFSINVFVTPESENILPEE